jgi:transcriptional regulator with XRE-family HTH domain
MLKDVRMKAGMRQKDVAEALGIKQTTYSAWETGRVPIPAHHLVKLVELFHVSVGELTAPPENNSLKDWEKKLLEAIRQQPNNMDYLLASNLTTFIEKTSFMEPKRSRSKFLRAFLHILNSCNQYADAYLFFPDTDDGLPESMPESAENQLDIAFRNYKYICQTLEVLVIDEDDNDPEWIDE